MSSKDSYEIGLKLGDAALRNLWFFIFICAAFGGWTLADDVVKNMRQFGAEHLALVSVFTISTIGLTYSEIQILRRVNAAIKLSRELFEKENNDMSEAASSFFRLSNNVVAGIAMIGTVLAIDVLMLFPQALQQNLSLSTLLY